MTSLEKDNYFILLAEQDSPFILIDKETNTTILKHPTQIYKKITDEDILNKITVITQTYGGSLITLFNHKNVWFAIKDNKFISIPGEFVQFMDEFDTNNYYLFLLNDNELINYYQKTILLSIKQKYNFSDVKYENYLSKIYYHQKIHFSCTDELSMFLESMSNKNYMTKKLTIEGVLIRLTDDIYVIMQTACYKQITLLKPQTNNIHVGFLEMYQRDKLSSFLPFYSNYSNDILHRINMSMKTLSKEILNIYHLTRNKKNMQLYELLPDIYKKAIYDIHGLYISYKKKKPLL